MKKCLKDHLIDIIKSLTNILKLNDDNFITNTKLKHKLAIVNKIPSIEEETKSIIEEN